MYVLMGANGNITSKAAKLLLSRGAKVRVVGRAAARMKALQDAGAELAVGNAQDAGLLAAAFRGATAIYTMIPPDYVSPDHRKYQNAVSEAIAQAIVKSGVKTVVNLSSVGASLPGGTGPIAGLHDNEERLNKLDGVNILHLRPAYFMENHLHAIGLIRATGVYPAMIAPDAPVAMIATRDIAAVVAEELSQPRFKGHTVRHLLGPRSVTMAEAARVLGAAIGKPDLKYVQADPAQAKQGMVAAGFSRNVAGLFEEMSKALSDGRINATFARDAGSAAPTTLESFAKEVFAPAWNAGGAH
ncbi:MAG TPA: NAD(P)H-binding protein [Burkholderiales bacterium]|nr:NAD(P)H-binding protein [Burkholderiales bacterium]